MTILARTLLALGLATLVVAAVLIVRTTTAVRPVASTMATPPPADAGDVVYASSFRTGLGRSRDALFDGGRWNEEACVPQNEPLSVVDASAIFEPFPAHWTPTMLQVELGDCHSVGMRGRWSIPAGDSLSFHLSSRVDPIAAVQEGPVHNAQHWYFGGIQLAWHETRADARHYRLGIQTGGSGNWYASQMIPYGTFVDLFWTITNRGTGIDLSLLVLDALSGDTIVTEADFRRDGRSLADLRAGGGTISLDVGTLDAFFIGNQGPQQAPSYHPNRPPGYHYGDFCVRRDGLPELPCT